MLKSNDTARNDFSNRIKALRAHKSLTPSELARFAQVSPASVWQWEKQGCVPRKPTIARLAAAFGVSAEFLLTGTLDAANETVSPPMIFPFKLDGIPLEDLMRAIEAKGFTVHVEMRRL